MSILNARIGQSIGFMVAAVILAIAATVLAFIFIVPEKKREKLNAFGKFLHDTCNFKYLVVEKLLQALYIFLTAYFILQGFFMLFQTSYGTWLGGAGLAIDNLAYRSAPCIRAAHDGGYSRKERNYDKQEAEGSERQRQYRKCICRTRYERNARILQAAQGGSGSEQRSRSSRRSACGNTGYDDTRDPDR